MVQLMSENTDAVCPGPMLTHISVDDDMWRHLATMAQDIIIYLECRSQFHFYRS